MGRGLIYVARFFPEMRGIFRLRGALFCLFKCPRDAYRFAHLKSRFFASPRIVTQREVLSAELARVAARVDLAG